MPTEKKKEAVADLKERIARATLLVSAEYRGLRVKEMQDLRRRLRDGGVEVKVVKNSLLARAADEAGQPDLVRIIEGPTALAISYGDIVEASRALAGYAATAPAGFAIRGGYMEGSVLTAADLRALVTLPPRPVLIGQFLGHLQSPLAGLLGLLESPLRELSGLTQAMLGELPGLIEARAKQLEAGA